MNSNTPTLQPYNPKLVFFGNEKLATGIPQPKRYILEAIQKAGFDIEQVVTGKLVELAPHTSRLAVLAAYGRIIPQRVLDEFPLGIINVHPSLLPAYRGPTPIEQAILDGAPKTGVSIMKLTAGMDEGPIYKQKSVHLAGNESKAELTETLQQLGAQLLVEVLPEIIAGNLKPRQQPHPDRVTYSKLLTKDDGVIDWQKPAEQLEREIRAYTGWPKSRAKIGEKEVIITEAHVVDKSGKPAAFEAHGKQLLAYCGQKALSIDKLKPAGKGEMSAQAFLAGYNYSLSKIPLS